MNKTTTTMLMAAGLMLLAGCKTEVMGNRHFKDLPDGEGAGKTEKQMPPPPLDDKKGGAAVVTDSGKDRKSSGRQKFSPMDGTYGNEGIEEAPCKRGAARRQKGAANAPAGKGSVYIVKRGDSLGSIARRHKVSVQALRQANNRTPQQDRSLRIGTKLVIPAGGAAVRAGKNSGKAVAPARRGGKAAPKLNANGTYTMVKGDNIPKIARKFGIRAKALQQANNLSDEDTTKLQIGHKLVIPTGADAQVSSRKSARKAASRKAVASKKIQEQPRQQMTPPPAENTVSAAHELPPPADNAASAAPAASPTLPPPAQAETVPAADGAETDFVSVTGFNSLEEFAAKYKTTVDEILRLNPRIDRNAPIANHGMLYVPRVK